MKKSNLLLSLRRFLLSYKIPSEFLHHNQLLVNKLLFITPLLSGVVRVSHFTTRMKFEFVVSSSP